MRNLLFKKVFYKEIKRIHVKNTRPLTEHHQASLIQVSTGVAYHSGTIIWSLRPSLDTLGLECFGGIGEVVNL
jgi:hypothetical protein